MPVLSFAKIVAKPGIVNFLRVNMATLGMVRQAKRFHGFREGAAAGGEGSFYTMSLWDDHDSIKWFVKSGAHGKAARRVANMATAHVAGHCPWEGPLPKWEDLGRLFADHGTLMRFGDDRSQQVLMSGPPKELWGGLYFEQKFKD